MNTGKAVHSVLSFQGPQAKIENFENNDKNFANYVLKSKVKPSVLYILHVICLRLKEIIGKIDRSNQSPRFYERVLKFHLFFHCCLDLVCIFTGSKLTQLTPCLNRDIRGSLFLHSFLIVSLFPAC